MLNSELHIHLVSFDIPYPANYGGVIDVFYKLKALHEAGIQVHLHCFEYGRTHTRVLEQYCRKVHYYQRRTNKNALLSRTPYIAATRNNPKLLANLLKDDYPILFEGLHCCYFLTHPDLQERVKIVRMHNIEHHYYNHLAQVENNFFKRYFFVIEAGKLRRFEEVLHHASAIAAISPADERHLSRRYGNVFHLPVFHANESLPELSAFGEPFALYHGNLGVGENNQAALFLVREVFSHISYPLVIAGMKPSPELRQSVAQFPHISIMEKVSTDDILNLIHKAHINILPTFQNTGIKLKLINVLYQGRHCIVNPAMVQHTGLESLCHIGAGAQEFIQLVNELKEKPYTFEEQSQHQHYLSQHFNNADSAQILINKIGVLEMGSL